MGAGYQVSELLRLNEKAQVIVYEFNERYYHWILNSGLITDVIADSRVEYRLIENNKDLKELSFLLSNPILLLRPSLQLVEEKYLDIIREIQSFLMIQETVKNQKVPLEENFLINVARCDPSFTECNLPKREDAILVSAGPSLSKQLENLKVAQESHRFIIGCVGTAFKPLMKYGIHPDFVMISDPLDNIVEQFIGLNNNDIPLFYLSTANSKAVAHYKGPCHIVWQRGYQSAEKEANIRNEPLVETGGSVATCLLDVMVKVGAKNIALIGQDLAFTNNQSHATGAHNTRAIHETSNLLKVKNYDESGSVSTSKNLFTYLRWFERYAERIKSVELWNCTEGGAFIKGWKHRTFKQFLGLT
jgi:hypothetical protein